MQFVFDGRAARGHVVDARQFGKSLIGIDKAVAAASFLLVAGRGPKPKERLPDVFVAAGEPQKGSVSVQTFIENAPWILPLAGEVIKLYGADFIRNFLSFLLFWHGGRKADAQGYMDAMIDVLKENNRSHEATTESWQRTLLEMVDKLAPAAREIVEPVGRTASELRFGSVGGGKVEIDEPTAEAIRSKEDLELMEKEILLVTVDGLTKRAKTLKLFLDDGSYVAADIRDPEFETEPNIYSDALHHGTPLLVTVRRAMRGDKLYKMYVLEARQPEAPADIRLHQA